VKPWGVVSTSADQHGANVSPSVDLAFEAGGATLADEPRDALGRSDSVAKSDPRLFSAATKFLEQEVLAAD
jgi:hypothetical protein